MDLFLNDAPLWLIGIIVAVALASVTELGFRLHRWGPGRVRTAPEKSDGGVHILGAVLGLLALILGFSFSMALDRYDGRRHLVLEEANAIGTAYLRVQILTEPDRTVLSDILRDYIDARLEYFRAGSDGAGQDAARKHTDDLHDKLWAATVVAVKPILIQDFATQLTESMNQVIDLASARRAAFGLHIPSSVMEVVILYALISSGMLGYVLAGAGQRHLVTSTILSVLLALVITLIIDIDRPNQGTVNVNIAPLLDVQAKLKRDATLPKSDAEAALVPPAQPVAPPAPQTDITYTCAGSVVLRAVFNKDFTAVDITFHDKSLRLTKDIAASGIRYTGDGYTFWSKGSDAFVMKGDASIITNCKQRAVR